MVRFQENAMLARQNLIFLDSEQIFDPLPELKEVSDKIFEFTNRLGHEFCVRPGFQRSFGDVFSELSGIHFTK